MKRRIVPLLIAALFLTSALALCVSTSADGASDGPSNPDHWTDKADYYDTSWYYGHETSDEFVIDSAKALAGLAVIVNGIAGTPFDFFGKTVTLHVNGGKLSISAHYWTPIGAYSDDGIVENPFRGTFNGGGTGLSGLFIGSKGDDLKFQGLFGIIGPGATIKDLGITDVNIFGESNIGGIVGWNDGGTVSGCHISGYITVSGEFNGGIAGINAGTISKCYFSGDIVNESEDSSATGGIVGWNDGTVSGCYNHGLSMGADETGGIVGHNTGLISESYNRGFVTGIISVGGIAGANYDEHSKIEKCYNFDSITLNGNMESNDNALGGIVGLNRGEVIYCYNSGMIFTSDENVGGIAAKNEGGTVARSYNTGILNGSLVFIIAPVGGFDVDTCYWLDHEDEGKGGRSIDQMVGGAARSNMPALFDSNSPFITVGNITSGFVEAGYTPQLKVFAESSNFTVSRDSMMSVEHIVRNDTIIGILFTTLILITVLGTLYFYFRQRRLSF